MAICVVVDSVGNLVSSASTPLAQCTSYILQDASEMLTYSIFNLPSGSDFAKAWSAGFILPMVISQVAFAVAKLVNFWR